MSWIYPQGIEGSNRDFSGSEQNLEEEETSKIQKREIDCLTSNNGKGVYMGGGQEGQCLPLELRVITLFKSYTKSKEHKKIRRALLYRLKLYSYFLLQQKLL